MYELELEATETRVVQPDCRVDLRAPNFYREAKDRWKKAASSDRRSLVQKIKSRHHYLSDNTKPLPAV